MKITKTQLQQIIKEEIQKELDESFLGGIKNFLTGGGLSADEQRAVDNRTKDILADQPNQRKEDAEKQAKYELKNGKLDKMGKLKGPEKKSPGVPGVDFPKLRQRSVAAGTKKPDRYYDHKTKGWKVR